MPGQSGTVFGHNSSMVVMASPFPGFNGNCIYFADNIMQGYYESPIWIAMIQAFSLSRMGLLKNYLQRDFILCCHLLYGLQSLLIHAGEREILERSYAWKNRLIFLLWQSLFVTRSDSGSADSKSHMHLCPSPNRQMLFSSFYFFNFPIVFHVQFLSFIL